MLAWRFVLCVTSLPLSRYFLLCSALFLGLQVLTQLSFPKEWLLSNPSWISRIAVVEWCAVPQDLIWGWVVIERDGDETCYLRKIGQGNEKLGVGAEMQLFLGCAGVPFLDIYLLFPLLLRTNSAHRQRKWKLQSLLYNKIHCWLVY